MPARKRKNRKNSGRQERTGKPGRTTPQIALLRGINVGRAKRVAMADLRELVNDLGYDDVRTLLNSGNVVFTSRTTPAKAAARIERGIAERLGVSSRVTVLTGDELATAVDENPLVEIADNPSRLFVASSPIPPTGRAASRCSRRTGSARASLSEPASTPCGALRALDRHRVRYVLVGELGDVEVPVADLRDLIRMKRAAGRPKDLIEVEVLSALLAEREGR
jgi:hypothetical protein